MRMFQAPDMSMAPSETVDELTPRRADDEAVAGAIVSPPGAVVSRVARKVPEPTWYDRLEAFVSRLSMRDNFWNSICSMLWLPLAFFSGIRMKELDPNSFAAHAILPFRRFNRNWYRAMAGGGAAGQ